MSTEVSIVLPAKNEADNLPAVLDRLKRTLPDAELIVVDDGSSDDTAQRAEAHGARVLRHQRSMGNGAAIKTGARNALGQIIVFMDADGQHDPDDVPALLEKIRDGYDLAVGTRDRAAQASTARMFGNWLYNRLASWMVGHPIPDLTSGMRAVRAERFREFLYLLPNGFSYPATSTMAFFRAGYQVAYVPIRVQQRARGSASHMRIFRDGSRFFLIIFKIGVLYSPLKLFAPMSALFFAAACWYYAYTYIEQGRFTNMGVLLFLSSALLFMLGLLSEQITTLMYMRLQDAASKPGR